MGGCARYRGCGWLRWLENTHFESAARAVLYAHQEPATAVDWTISVWACDVYRQRISLYARADEGGDQHMKFYLLALLVRILTWLVGDVEPHPELEA